MLRTFPLIHFGLCAVLFSAIPAVLMAEEQQEAPVIPIYLQPIWEAAAQPIILRPETQRAQLEFERAKWALRAEGSAWRPTVYAHTNSQLSEQESNNSNEAGSSNTVVRTTTNSGEIGLNQRFSTGTEVSISSSSSRETNNRRNSFLQESWVSRVRLSLSQDLLRGGSRQANLKATRDAEEHITANREQIAEEVLNAFTDLSAAWLEFGRAQTAHSYALQALDNNLKALEIARARFDSGLSSRREMLARERDLAEQQATVGRLLRDVTLQQDELILRWGLPQIPAIKHIGISVDEAQSLKTRDQFFNRFIASSMAESDTDFSQTLAGRGAQRDLESAQRNLQSATVDARDSLQLEAGVGFSGRDRDFSSSWDALSASDSFDVNVGLRYEHIIGGSRQRAERERSRLAVHQAEWDFRRAERDWQLERNTRQRSREDALADITERSQTQRATKEERDLILAEFESGKTSIRDFLDAEQRLRNADQELINAYFSVLIDDLRLRQHLNKLPFASLMAGEIPGHTPRDANEP